MERVQKMSEIELRDDAPPAVVGSGGIRDYSRYNEQTAALRANTGRWLKLTEIPITSRAVPVLDAAGNETGETRPSTPNEDERDARRRAGNRAAMVRAGKGAWAGDVWQTRIAQPDGEGTPLQLWVSHVRARTAEELEALEAEAATRRAERDAKAAEAQVPPPAAERVPEGSVGDAPAPVRRRRG
jgi:hypothetical protein